MQESFESQDGECWLNLQETEMILQLETQTHDVGSPLSVPPDLSGAREH